ncbi:MAG: hypothetical protein ACYSWU_22360 [Planctomycetota bacterium]
MTKDEDVETENLLIKAMAGECRGLILKWNEPALDLPEALQTGHLERMCDRIEKHADDWSTAKLHRWIGFVQCAMMANRVLDLNGIKAMFDRAKNAYGETSADLLDHLDPEDFFEFDIGGEG